ncbi:MAG: hypothetical protein VB835_10350 [Pirellulales bacterium]
MFSRIYRALSTLFVVIAAYLVYSLTVAPAIEPAMDVTSNHGGGHAEYSPREQLRNFFPEDAWELRNPTIIENSQFKLLLQDYESLPGGIVKIQPCTLIFCPDGNNQILSPADRVLIMQAPKGALLQFDDNADISRAKMGRLQAGRLVGEVTIRGNLNDDSSASSADGQELLIATRDIELQPKRIWTQHAVQFQIGKSHGSGRELHIEMPQGLNPRAGNGSSPLGDVRSIEILKDVQLYVDANTKGLLPGKHSRNVTAGGQNAAERDPQPPMEIRCKGAFRFDVSKLTATFENEVDVVRLNHQGPSDQLNCEVLTIQFARGRDDKNQPAGAEGSQAPPRSLRVAAIVASGSPVVAASPSVSGFARGEFFKYDVTNRVLELSAQNSVTLTYQDSQIEAARIRYKEVDGHRLGQVWATGPGQFQTTVPGKLPQKLISTWQGNLTVEPHGDKQVMSLTGKTRVQYGNSGSLHGEEIRLWLLEHQRDVDSRPDSPQDADYSPLYLLAQGNVDVHSPQLSGKTKKLEAWFEAAVTAATNRSSGGLGSNLTNGGSGSSASKQYQFQGDQVQLLFGMPPSGPPHLKDANISGTVRLAEATTAARAPLVLTGQQVLLQRANADNSVVSITGAPAQVAATDFSITAAAIQLDKRTNELLIDGAGTMSLPVDRDLNGNKLSATQPVDISWQGSMSFDGLTVHFDRDVIAKTRHQQLRTSRLAVRLNQKISFLQRVDRRDIAVAGMDCTGGVTIDSTTIEGERQTAVDRLQIDNLSVDQTTGRIQADGAGWLSSIRESTTNEISANLQPVDRNQQLIYMRTEFQHGISGNLNDREVVFNEQVRCIYGPVDQWTDELNSNRPEGPQGREILLTCRRLSLRQMGEIRGRRNIELEAVGKAIVEGELFTAEGEKLSYSTGKELLILQGAGQSDARLTHQKQVGGRVTKTVAQRISYWRTTGHVKAEGIRFGGGTFESRSDP